MSKEAMKLAQEIAAQYNKAERFQTWTHDFMMQRLMELVAISAAAEREACAMVCDELHPGLSTKRVAEIIRARSKNEDRN